MSYIRTDNIHYINIAGAIREQLGTSSPYTPAQMPAAIRAISFDGGTKTITTNGTYDPADDGLDAYTEVTVNVSVEGFTTRNAGMQTSYTWLDFETDASEG